MTQKLFECHDWLQLSLSGWCISAIQTNAVTHKYMAARKPARPFRLFFASLPNHAFESSLFPLLTFDTVAHPRNLQKGIITWCRKSRGAKGINVSITRLLNCRYTYRSKNLRADINHKVNSNVQEHNHRCAQKGTFLMLVNLAGAVVRQPL
jgi:hypothetical protein